jgi:plastocyanin
MAQPDSPARRKALRCMAYGSAGTLYVLAGGVVSPFELAQAASAQPSPAGARPLFVQLSDTHIGFAKEANPDVAGTLTRTIELVNALPAPPALCIHTGDITHLSKPEEFDRAQQLLAQLRTAELHTVPGEHDVADAGGAEYFRRFGGASNNKGYYSFDHSGVHFVALTNVLAFKPGGLGALGAEQLTWAIADLEARTSSTPIVVFAHMPLWTIYEPWGWGTADAEQLTAVLRRFGSVTVLNGHIHQIVQKVEGHMTFHTARSTAYPQPAPGAGPGPGPLTVPAEQLAGMLGLTSIRVVERPRALALTDTTLAPAAPESARISMRNFSYQPASLHVKAGTTVTWTNLDEEPHTVTSDAGAFRSGALDTHEAFAFTFRQRGTFRFLCSLHPSMSGTIIVE